MTTVNQSKRYLGNRSVYAGPNLPETDLKEGFLFYKTDVPNKGLYIYINNNWEIVFSEGTTVKSFNTRNGDVTLLVSDITSIDGSGSGIDADLLDGVDGSGYSLISHDHTGTYSLVGHNHTGQYLPLDVGHNNVGSFCLARIFIYNLPIAPNTIWPGSVLNSASAAGDVSGSPLSGTWRCLGFVPGVPSVSNDTYTTLFQRIA